MTQNNNAKTPSKRLRQKLLFYLLGFSAIILGFLWLTQMVFLDDLYRLIKTASIEKNADYIVEHIADADISRVLDEIHEKNDIGIEVYDTNSGIGFYQMYTSREQGDWGLDYFPHQLYSYYKDTKENGGEMLFSEEPLEGLRQNEEHSEMPRHEQEGVLMLTCTRLTEFEDKEVMVVLRSAITPIESTVTTMRFILIIISVFLLILSSVMSVVISGKLSKPLRDTTEKANRLAAEDYSVSFDSSGYREIEELNSTLNFAASELGLAANLRKELIANVSHDLRTPLTMIKGYAEVMKDIPGEMNEENLQAIIDESTRLSNLVSDLLDISKLQSGAVPIEKKSFSITACTEDILTRFSMVSQQQGYKLRFERSEEVSVFADKARIEQVLYNLISNAINYSDSRKEITVLQTVRSGVVRIEIIDSGKGIEPEKLQHIWDRYYRADKNHQRAVVGSGLGLSIVKEILDLHKAHFGVTSELHKGSTFWFELPAESMNS